LHKMHKMHKTKQGETWDLISLAEYGTPYKVADLINANPEYSDVLIFDEGIYLNIPQLEAEKISSLPPWKQGV